MAAFPTGTSCSLPHANARFSRSLCPFLRALSVHSVPSCACCACALCPFLCARWIRRRPNGGRASRPRADREWWDGLGQSAGPACLIRTDGPKSEGSIATDDRNLLVPFRVWLSPVPRAHTRAGPSLPSTNWKAMTRSASATTALEPTFQEPRIDMGNSTLPRRLEATRTAVRGSRPGGNRSPGLTRWASSCGALLANRNFVSAFGKRQREGRGD